MGYHRAGFDVVGVDIKPQPRFPFTFVQGDALNPPVRLDDFDAIHASPPCQAYSALRNLPWLKDKEYWDSIPPTLEFLSGFEGPWIVENVERAPLEGIRLCGTMFGLKCYRHRLFASNVLLMQPEHQKHKVVIGKGRMLNDRAKGNLHGWVSLPGKATNEVDHRSYAGHFSGVERARKALGIDWMTRDDLSQAIPPAYTEFIGRQLMRHLTA